MDYKFYFFYEASYFKCELRNEFNRAVAWAYNKDMKRAVSEVLTWQIMQNKQDTKDVINSFMELDLKEIEKCLRLGISPEDNGAIIYA